MFSFLQASFCLLPALCFAPVLQAQATEPILHAHQHSQHATAQYQLREMPNPLGIEFTQQIDLLESNGSTIQLQQLLKADTSGSEVTDTHIIQFIFTSCKNICPVMSTIVQAIQSEVQGKANLISISIDPQYDRPEQLREYAQLFGALPHWRFFTGELDDIVSLQKKLSVYQQNKMQHQPVTFVVKAARLFRIDGLPSRAAMLSVLDNIRDKVDSEHL